MPKGKVHELNGDIVKALDTLIKKEPYHPVDTYSVAEEKSPIGWHNIERVAWITDPPYSSQYKEIWYKAKNRESILEHDEAIMACSIEEITHTLKQRHPCAIKGCTRVYVSQHLEQIYVTKRPLYIWKKGSTLSDVLLMARLSPNGIEVRYSREDILPEELSYYSTALLERGYIKNDFYSEVGSIRWDKKAAKKKILENKKREEKNKEYVTVNRMNNQFMTDTHQLYIDMSDVIEGLGEILRRPNPWQIGACLKWISEYYKAAKLIGSKRKADRLIKTYIRKNKKTILQNIRKGSVGYIFLRDEFDFEFPEKKEG